MVLNDAVSIHRPAFDLKFISALLTINGANLNFIIDRFADKLSDYVGQSKIDIERSINYIKSRILRPSDFILSNIPNQNSYSIDSLTDSQKEVALNIIDCFINNKK